MDESEARKWIESEFGVSRETMALLDRYVAMLLDEGERQNLIARSTFATVWSRHILDSAQLLTLADGQSGAWIDLGSGPGLPGMVLAILGSMPITLVESRAKRVAFLHDVVEALGLSNVAIEGKRLERVPPQAFRVITGRAFAPLPKLLDLAAPFANRDTIWLLPKGRNVEEELASIKPLWQGEFDTMKSLSDDQSYIIRATQIRRRRRRA